MIRWLHRLRGHSQVSVRVTSPLWDPTAKGILIKCSCRKRWAK